MRISGLILSLAVLLGPLPPSPPAAAAPRTTPRTAEATRAPERRLVLEDLEIHGNRKTRPAVILRLLDLEVGGDVTPERLAAGRRRLLESGFFSEVRFSTRPGRRRAGVVIVLELKERHRPYLDTGFGFRDPEGWYLTLIGLRLENPIGLGGRMSAGLRFGFRVVGAELGWSLPVLPRHGISLDLGLDLHEEQMIWYRTQPGWRLLYHEFRQKVDRVDAGAMLVWRPNRRFALEGGFVAARLTPETEARNRSLDEAIPYDDLPAELRRENGVDLDIWQIGLSLGEGGMEDRPGRSLHLRGRLYTGVGDTAADFARLSLTCRSTTRLRPGHSLGLGLRAGYVGDEAPVYERFRLGGSYSLRGFADHSLSPVQGHRSFWTVSSEYRFRMAGGRGDEGLKLTGLVFLDAGAGRLAPDTPAADADYERLQAGAGYGVRLEVPWLGAVGLDLGFPVTRGVNGDAVVVYLTLGYNF